MPDTQRIFSQKTCLTNNYLSCDPITCF